MICKQISDKSFIIPLTSTSGVDKVVNKLNRKRERLIEEGQIKETDFEPMSVSYKAIKKEELSSLKDKGLDFLTDKLIKASPNGFLIATFNSEAPNINQWQVLGTIKPIDNTESEYVLNSFNSADMPKKYRDLEEPNTCEHCNTNRKRNNTFVIRNKNTQEVLQVGSSCMDDFISKDELSFLMTYTSLADEIMAGLKNNKIKPVVTLYNKNEFIATMLAVSDKISSLRDKGLTERSLDVYNLEEKEIALLKDPANVKLRQDIEYLKSFQPTDDHRDRADDVLDFYEDLKVGEYNDLVFNHYNLINSNSDFMLKTEIYQMQNLLSIKSGLEQGGQESRQYLSNFQEGIDIKTGERTLPSREKILLALKLSNTKFPFVKFGENNRFNSVVHAQCILNPRYAETLEGVIDEPELSLYKNKIKGLHYFLNSQFNSNENIQYVEELKSVLTSAPMKNDFHQNVEFNVVNRKIETELDVSEILRMGIWAHKIKSAFDIAQKKSEIAGKLEDMGLGGRMFDSGDSIDRMEVKITDRIKKESDWGQWYEFSAEDQKGNLLMWTSNDGSLKESEESFDMDNYKNKWIEIKGRFSEMKQTLQSNHKSLLKSKFTHVKMVSESPSDEPQTNGEPIMNDKGKRLWVNNYKVVAKTIVPHNDKEYISYALIDASATTPLRAISLEDMGLEEGKVYKIGHFSKRQPKFAGKEYIQEIDDLSLLPTLMTKAAMNKDFGVKEMRKVKKSIII